MAKAKETKSLVEEINKLKGLLEDAMIEAEKFSEKSVNVAGGRCRKALQDIKKEIKPIRDLITEIKNSRKK
jgi:predicted transcriptional regulator